MKLFLPIALPTLVSSPVTFFDKRYQLPGSSFYLHSLNGLFTFLPYIFYCRKVALTVLYYSEEKMIPVNSLCRPVNRGIG